MPVRWTLSILPLPKRQAMARATGFCGGVAVGESEGRGISSTPQWWPRGAAVALEYPGRKRISVGNASGTTIPGSWKTSSGWHGGAFALRFEGGPLVPQELHPRTGWAWTEALGAGGGCVAGYGERKVKKGTKAVEQALLWRVDGGLVELPPATPNDEALAQSTDGVFVVGRAGRTGGQQAALWPADGSAIVLLGDGRSVSEAHGVADGEQVGVKWTGLTNAAALWRGSASSYVDLTPEGFEVGWAAGCARGRQVGLVKARETTPAGMAHLPSRAALWNGTAASFVDLHAYVPEPWNSSAATAIEIGAKGIRICGVVTQYGASDEGTPRESHYVVAERAAVWETEGEVDAE